MCLTLLNKSFFRTLKFSQMAPVYPTQSFEESTNLDWRALREKSNIYHFWIDIFFNIKFHFPIAEAFHINGVEKGELDVHQTKSQLVGGVNCH